MEIGGNKWRLLFLCFVVLRSCSGDLHSIPEEINDSEVDTTTESDTTNEPTWTPTTTAPPTAQPSPSTAHTTRPSPSTAYTSQPSQTTTPTTSKPGSEGTSVGTTSSTDLTTTSLVDKKPRSLLSVAARNILIAFLVLAAVAAAAISVYFVIHRNTQAPVSNFDRLYEEDDVRFVPDTTEEHSVNVNPLYDEEGRPIDETAFSTIV